MEDSNKRSFFYRAFHLYWDGFHNMRLGKTLWLIILIKLFIIFIVLKIFFFPNFLNRYGDDQSKQNYISHELIQRAYSP